MAGDLRRWVVRRAPPVAGGGIPGDILRWVWRNAPIGAIGRVCIGTITMTIPGVTIAMTIPAATLSMTVPSATIDIEDCP